jgi:hypothetical protein
VKPLHHRVSVGVHRQHGKSEHFIALRVAPLSVYAGKAHGHFAMLLYLPSHSLTGLPTGLEEVFDWDDATPTFGTGLTEAVGPVHGLAAGVVGLFAIGQFQCEMRQ